MKLSDIPRHNGRAKVDLPAKEKAYLRFNVSMLEKFKNAVTMADRSRFAEIAILEKLEREGLLNDE